MKTALLTALALGLAVAGFSQEPAQGKPQDPAVKQGKGMPQRGKGMRRAPGMMGGNRGEMTAKIEFPQEWAALEKQRTELIAKAREKMKEFREAVRKYRETKDEASLKLIKESMGKRYDYFVAQYNKKKSEKLPEGHKPGPMAQKLKERMEQMIAEGKDKWVEKQIQFLTAPRKRGPRAAGEKAPAAEKK